MRKLKLDIDALAVETFDPAPLEDGVGTVEGQQHIRLSPLVGSCGFACVTAPNSCIHFMCGKATFWELTCAQQTCGFSCDPTCPLSCRPTCQRTCQFRTCGCVITRDTCGPTCAPHLCTPGFGM